MPETTPTPTSGHRRRPSTQTAFFALPTSSEYFRKIEWFKPTKIVGILFLEDASPNVDQIRAHIVDKLLQFPRFASRVTEDGYFERIPLDEIDQKYHFQVIDGKGSFSPDDEVSEMVSEAHLMDWDQDKPLWKASLITNTKDGRSMVVAILDHTLGDGANLGAIMVSLFDKKEEKEKEDSGDSSKDTKKSLTKMPPPSLRLSHRILLNLYAVYYGLVGLALVPTDPDNCLRIPREHKRSIPKGRKCSYTRQFSLEEVKAMKNRFPGATLNDVMTAVATIAIRRYLEQKQEMTSKRSIQLNVAINYRDPSTTLEDLLVEGGSNRVVVGILKVPLDFSSPIDAVWKCRDRMEIFKRTYLVPIVWKTTTAFLDIAPKMLVDHLSCETFSRATGAISNIRGPDKKEALGGYVIDDIAFYGTAPSQGSYLGIFSYNNQIRIYLCIDKRVEADADEFRDTLEAAYEELKASVEAASPAELAPPDMTPLVARVLEWTVPVVLVVLFGRWCISK